MRRRRSDMNRLHLLYCGIMCYVLTVAVQAKVIMYENGDSSPFGQNFLMRLLTGGDDDSLSWYGSFASVEPGLQYTNAGVLCTSGKAFSITNRNALRQSLSDIFPKEYLDGNDSFKPSSKEIWISFLMKVKTVHDPKTNYCGLFFRDTRRSLFFLGQRNGEFGINMPSGKNVEAVRKVPAETDKTHLLVIKMTCKKYQYFLELWVDPVLNISNMPPVTADFPEQRHPAETLVFYTRGVDCIIDEIRIGETRRDVMPSMLFTGRDEVINVTGNRENGTGFITEEEGKTYLYTSFDLLIKNKKVSFANQKGKQFRPKKIECATDRDLVRLVIDDSPANPFSIVAPKGINVPVSICSFNEEFKRSCTLDGTLLGVGPAKIEIDAPLETALRGSPILNSDKNVIGTSSYARETRVDWITRDTPFARTRQFGLRIDNVPKWEAIPLKKFAGDASVLRKKLLDFIAAVSLVRRWAWEPYYNELELDDDLPKTLQDWVMQHNDNAKRNSARRKKARRRRMSEDNAKKEMYDAVSEECRRLCRILKKPARKSVPKVNSTYLKNLYDDIDKAEKEMLAFLETFIDKVTSVNPLEIPDPENLRIFIEVEED